MVEIPNSYELKNFINFYKVKSRQQFRKDTPFHHQALKVSETSKSKPIPRLDLQNIIV